MRRELFAGGLLLILFGLSLFNTRSLSSLTEEIHDLVELADLAAERGDWEDAESRARLAVSRWDESSAYTHVILKHSDIDAFEESLYRFLESVASHQYPSSRICAELVYARLRSLRDMERLIIGSIF